MKILITLIMIPLLLATIPVSADNPHAYGAGKASQEQKTYRKETGQGAMEQEQHRERAHKEVGKETGKGPAQGQPSGPKQEKKWWKFWE
jgi:hypothetical protein